jgi:MYXO-CTERM domain-containing protein
VIDPVVGQYVNLTSADLTSAWIPGLQVRVDGFNTNLDPLIPIRTTTVTVNPTGPTLFDFSTLGGGFNGLNKLTFTSFVSGSPIPNPTGTEFVMDDFKFSTTTTGGTPEPGSIVLCAMGFAGLALAAWRRRRSRPAA